MDWTFQDEGASDSVPSAAQEPGLFSPKAVLQSVPTHALPRIPASIESVSVTAVIKGALMTVAFGPGTNPAAVPDLLRALDPGVKLQDDFPRNKAFGPRESKPATIMMIQLNVQPDKPRVKLVSASVDGGEEVTISAFGDKAKSFPEDLAALGVVSPAIIERVRAAYQAADGSDKSIVLPEAEQFVAMYSPSKDGKLLFLEGFQGKAVSA